MNGRLYDPVVGRFLSPDNYVQAPDFTQSFNRYSYVWNNPLRYTDPDGEWVHLVVGAVIGGTFNLIVNWNNIDGDFLKGLGYFGVGAVAGALSAGIGAGVNVAISGAGTFGAGFMGNAAAIGTGFNVGFVAGASSGFAGGFASEFGNVLLNNGNIGDAFNSGLTKGGWGALGGAVIGGISGGINAKLNNRNFWSGSEKFEKRWVTDGNKMISLAEWENNSYDVTRSRHLVKLDPSEDPISVTINLPNKAKYEMLAWGRGADASQIDIGRNSVTIFLPNGTAGNSVGLQILTKNTVINQLSPGGFFHNVNVANDPVFWWSFVTSLKF
jgi:hypothetical protein